MESPRKFWIINSLGNRFDLIDNNENKCILVNPAGLGFSRSYSVVNIGSSELLTDYNLEMVDFTGELVFYDDSNGKKYQNYENFVQFVKYKPLQMYYQPPNVLEDSAFYADVLLVSTEKTEISSDDSTLRIPLTFHRLSQWLTASDIIYTLTNDPIDAGKYYELVRDYHYTGTNLSNTVINVTGTNDIGFTFIIEGEVQNPKFTLTQNGEEYGICKIDGTYDFVRIDSEETVESIYLERNGSTISNPESHQDFTVVNGHSYITWCKLRVGETLFNFTCGNIDTFDGVLKISFKNSYASV